MLFWANLDGTLGLLYAVEGKGFRWSGFVRVRLGLIRWAGCKLGSGLMCGVWFGSDVRGSGFLRVGN